VLDEHVSRVAQCFREPDARVRVVDDEPQHVATDPILAESDFHEVVGRVHIDTQRTILGNMRVLIATEIEHCFSLSVSKLRMVLTTLDSIPGRRLIFRRWEKE
jgi:hypothetical protein